jgi:multidrug efflux system outer membrane protein
VRQFESEVAQSAGIVATYTRLRVEKENQLSLLLGRAPATVPRGRALEQAVQALAVPDSLPAELVVRRPDVLRAQHDWQAATARIGVAVANRLPTFFVTGSYGTNRPDFNRLFSSSGEVYGLQGGVSVPLVHGGKLVNQERAARARADQAKALYEQTVLAALGEASSALAGVRLTRDEIVAQQTQAQALRRALSLARQRYESGIASYLEVLDAQRQLFAAELSLVQVQRAYLVAAVQLYKALGGTWTDIRGSSG